MDPADVDAVVLSHIHVDHSTDVLALYAYLAYGRTDWRTVRVLAPQGAAERIAAFAGADDEDHAFHRVLTFDSVGEGSSVQIGDLEVEFAEATHPVPAVVTCLRDGSSSLTYSGDTGPGGGLIAAATGVDLLLCEASLQGVRAGDTYAYHLTAREAGEIAAMAGAGELVLTHVPAFLDPQLSIDEASSAFVGSVAYAAPGATFSTDR
jgi:ribonuclease BN (tRNA processing enzyme)